MVPIDAYSTGAGLSLPDASVGAYGAAVGYFSQYHLELNPGLVGFRSNSDIWDLRADRLELRDASRFEYTSFILERLRGSRQQ